MLLVRLLSGQKAVSEVLGESVTHRLSAPCGGWWFRVPKSCMIQRSSVLNNVLFEGNSKYSNNYEVSNFFTLFL